jgi:hypothetical protein
MDTNYPHIPPRYPLMPILTRHNFVGRAMQSVFFLWQGGPLFFKAEATCALRAETRIDSKPPGGVPFLAGCRPQSEPLAAPEPGFESRARADAESS